MICTETHIESVENFELSFPVVHCMFFGPEESISIITCKFFFDEIMR